MGASRNSSQKLWQFQIQIVQTDSEPEGIVLYHSLINTNKMERQIDQFKVDRESCCHAFLLRIKII